MNIAIVSNTKWSVYNFRLGLLKELSSQGSSVTILSPNEDIKGSYKRIRKVSNKSISLSRRSVNPINDIKLWLRLLFEFKLSRYDCVINYTIKPAIYSSLACRVLRIPCITVITGLGYAFKQENTILKYIVVSLYRLALKKTDHVLFLNNDDLELFRKNKIISKNSGQLLPSEGINTKTFCYKPMRQRDKTKFLFIGRFLEEKGIVDFTNAARDYLKNYSDAEFSILGSIDEENPSSIDQEQVDSWTKEGIINNLGFIEDVRKAIEDHHCIVLPSYYREGIPRSLLESLAIGRIIITTNSVGCREVLSEGKNGFSCRAKDSMSLVSAFEKVTNLADHELERMGRYACNDVSLRFNESRIVQIYNKLIYKAPQASD